jgi:hypothetical protein
MIRVGAPFVCADELALESREYTPEDGGVGIERIFYCQNAETGTREDITIKAIVASGLIYSAAIFSVLLVLTIISRLRSAMQPASVATGVATAPAAMSPAPAPISQDSADTAARLRQLAELRASGVLTEQEYETKRAEILAKL